MKNNFVYFFFGLTTYTVLTTIIFETFPQHNPKLQKYAIFLFQRYFCHFELWEDDINCNIRSRLEETLQKLKYLRILQKKKKKLVVRGGKCNFFFNDGKPLQDKATSCSNFLF